MVSRIVDFVTTDIWRLRLKNYPPKKSWLIKQLRIIILAVRGYMEDNCKFRASALTFFTLMSIVPVIAMMFAVAKGFGQEGQVEEFIMTFLEGQKELAADIILYSNNLLESTKGGFIAVFGIVFLFWAIIKVLSNIENSFNEIWGIKRGRHIGRKFSDYLSMMLICPILLILAGTMTVAVNKNLLLLVENLPKYEEFWIHFVPLLKLTRYAIVWVVFTFVFMFMPNTKVKLTSGLIGGIVAGTLFQLTMSLYFSSQVGMAKYNAIYGSLAAPLMFLIWIQLSWLVVLFGAELSFAHQNVDTYEFEPDCLKASYSFRRLAALTIIQRLIENFCQGKPASTAEQLSHQMEMPIRLVRELLFELVESGIASQARDKKGDRIICYQPGQDVDRLTVKFVIDALEKNGSSEIPIPKTDQMHKLEQCLNEMQQQAETSKGNILLKSITS
jgi:membrane protein